MDIYGFFIIINKNEKENIFKCLDTKFFNDLGKIRKNIIVTGDYVKNIFQPKYFVYSLKSGNIGSP